MRWRNSGLSVSLLARPVSHSRLARKVRDHRPGRLATENPPNDPYQPAHTIYLTHHRALARSSSANDANLFERREPIHGRRFARKKEKKRRRFQTKPSNSRNSPRERICAGSRRIANLFGTRARTDREPMLANRLDRTLCSRSLCNTTLALRERKIYCFCVW